MWLKVAIFYAERHTSLIQPLQQGILYVFKLQTILLTAVLLVLYDQTLVLCSLLLFPVDRAVHRKKGLAVRDQPDLSSAQGVIVFSIS